MEGKNSENCKNRIETNFYFSKLLYDEIFVCFEACDKRPRKRNIVRYFILIIILSFIVLELYSTSILKMLKINKNSLVDSTS